MQNSFDSFSNNVTASLIRLKNKMLRIGNSRQVDLLDRTLNEIDAHFKTYLDLDLDLDLS